MRPSKNSDSNSSNDKCEFIGAYSTASTLVKDLFKAKSSQPSTLFWSQGSRQSEEKVRDSLFGQSNFFSQKAASPLFKTLPTGNLLGGDRTAEDKVFKNNASSLSILSESSVLEPPLLRLDRSGNQDEFNYISVETLYKLHTEFTDDNFCIRLNSRTQAIYLDTEQLEEELVSPLLPAYTKSQQSNHCIDPSLDGCGLSGENNAAYDKCMIEEPLTHTFASPSFQNNKLLEKYSDYKIKSLQQNCQACPISMGSIRAREVRGVSTRLLVVDCRYQFEYQGGHIPGAININCPSVLGMLFHELRSKKSSSDFIDKLLYIQDREISCEDITLISSACEKIRILKNASNLQATSSQHPNSINISSIDDQGAETEIIIIFHCEFSSQRGPNLIRHWRSLDREYNEYPELTFPQIYVLRGGYEAWAGLTGAPYLPMYCKDHKEQMIAAEQRLAQEWKALKTKPIK